MQYSKVSLNSLRLCTHRNGNKDFLFFRSK